MPPPSSELIPEPPPERELGPVGRAFACGFCLLLGLPLAVAPWRDLGEDSLPLLAAVSLAGVGFVVLGVHLALGEGRARGRWWGRLLAAVGAGFYLLLVGALLFDNDDIDYSGGSGRGPDSPGEALFLGVLLGAPVVVGGLALLRTRR